MADQDKPSELSLSRFYDDLGAWDSVQFDKKLLIDVRELAIGPMISEGTYSVVYEGLYRSMPVAIKVIQADISAIMSPELQEKFIREVSMLSRVNHDNIVKLIGVAVEPTMMIITELMRGNLLLTEDKRKIKLADFGLAREEADDDMTTEAGTYRWMAPELFSVEALHLGIKKHYDHKVDVYSFSMVLWELLTNRTPFKGRNNIMVAYAAATNRRPSVDDIPPPLARLLQSCWAENPDHRPEFQQITVFLENFLRSICLPTNTSLNAPPGLFEAGYSGSKEEIEESPPADFLMETPKETKKKQRSVCLSLSITRKSPGTTFLFVVVLLEIRPYQGYCPCLFQSHTEVFSGLLLQ
ncbi:Serine/threonine-protein kinase STY13 [Sesamum angolense]|uniref:Serine/threonine-protein kinase STY13 n=1 Tax=Sesamum angolense TaxID=2727404 RepID=A0AAE1WHR8_9LAMI|nr:Serine/threonine-protein kinase STY13 [Sesamum angolense]